MHISPYMAPIFVYSVHMRSWNYLKINFGARYLEGVTLD